MEIPELTIYRLWYEWLKRTDPCAWTPLMQETLIDCAEPFEKWWDECKQYFLPADETVPLWVLKDDHDWNAHHEPDDPDELIVRLNVYCSLQAITEALKELLREKLERKAGRPKHQDDGDLFVLARSADGPTIEALNRMLLIYDMRRSTSLRWWQIGEAINLNPDYVTATGDTQGVITDKRRRMTRIASRYHAEALFVLENVVMEIFPPDFSKVRQ